MLYNQLLEKCVLPLTDVVRRTSFIKWLNYWRSIQSLNEDELEKLQQLKLQRILSHAAQTIPHYKYLRNKEKLTLNDFPIIHKSEIKNNIDDFMWHPHLKHELICEKSSGSSGIQGTIYMSREEQSKVIALQTLLWEWAGYKIGSPMLQTGITPNRSLEKKIKDSLFKVRYEAAFGLNKKDILTALDSFKDTPQAIFGGYASSLFIYAQTALAAGRKDLKFKTIISWGDKLFDHYRTTIEKAFNCRVFDLYGTTEGFVIAGQKDVSFPYILTPQVFLELLNEKGEMVKDGEIGQVVVTHLDAYEMPLIRYNLGDLAIKLPRTDYPTERELAFPLLKKIIGRNTDIIHTPKGNSMVVHSFTGIFEHIPEIKQFRVIQHELSEIIIEYLPDRGFSPTILQTIESRILGELNESISVKFTEVNHIPDSPSGKPQLIVSTLQPTSVRD